MNKILAYAKLPFQFKGLQAWQEVQLILNREIKHFNSANYSGGWTVIALRSPKGKAEAIIPDIREGEIFSNTELMDYCPTIKEFIRSFKSVVMSVRLLNLKTGAVIREHRDSGLSFEKGEARLHTPVSTNKHVEFYVEGQKVFMQEGECWYINANLPHRVSNFGQTDRVHLVIDCQVNDWLTGVFDSAEIYYSNKSNKVEELQMIIRELRAQNTETSNKLAEELQSELDFKYE